MTQRGGKEEDKVLNFAEPEKLEWCRYSRLSVYGGGVETRSIRGRRYTYTRGISFTVERGTGGRNREKARAPSPLSSSLARPSTSVPEVS